MHVNSFQELDIYKLTDADGEQLETQHWIKTAVDCKYINADQADNLLDRYALIGRMLNSMMTKADKFCSERRK